MHFLRVNLLAMALLALSATLAAAAGPPNIVYIIADDQGWKDVGYHGSDIKTPNIDALAAGGARLEQFYAQPICTQTRAALMTGRYPFRYGLQTTVIPSSHAYGLATDEYLLPRSSEGGRLRDGADRQMAPRPCRQEILADAARLRPSLRPADWRDRLFHA